MYTLPQQRMQKKLVFNQENKWLWISSYWPDNNNLHAGS